MTPFAIQIILITALDIVGIICAKFYSINKNNWLLFATVIFFGAAGYTFAKSLKYEGAAITNILWIGLSTVLVGILGYFIFKEEISSIQLIGMAVIVIGLVLINLK